MTLSGEISLEAEKADANKCAGFFGALGMCYNQAVKVRYRLGSRNCKQRARASVVRRSLKEAYYGIAEMKTDMERFMIEPPCTERFARWCERSANQLMVSFLLD